MSQQLDRQALVAKARQQIDDLNETLGKLGQAQVRVEIDTTEVVTIGREQVTFIYASFFERL
ncbi:hypothetical protein Pan1_07 [Pseudanabaena phage Pan1]|nr:hypothetical protein Pan1_07 [Pseudanabaena phage Pan1]